MVRWLAASCILIERAWDYRMIRMLPDACALLLPRINNKIQSNTMWTFY